jgi:hypothetical protein
VRACSRRGLFDRCDVVEEFDQRLRRTRARADGPKRKVPRIAHHSRLAPRTNRRPEKTAVATGSQGRPRAQSPAATGAKIPGTESKMISDPITHPIPCPTRRRSAKYPRRRAFKSSSSENQRPVTSRPSRKPSPIASSGAGSLPRRWAVRKNNLSWPKPPFFARHEYALRRRLLTRVATIPPDLATPKMPAGRVSRENLNQFGEMSVMPHQ